MIRLLPLVLMMVCTSGKGGGDDTDLPACGAAGQVTEVASGLTGGTEGLAFGDDGTLYVGNDDQVVTVAADGTITPLAAAPSVVGLAWWRGAVWAASCSRGARLPA